PAPVPMSRSVHVSRFPLPASRSFRSKNGSSWRTTAPVPPNHAFKRAISRNSLPTAIGSARGSSSSSLPIIALPPLRTPPPPPPPPRPQPGLARAGVQQPPPIGHGASRDEAEEHRVIPPWCLCLLLAFDAREHAFEHRQTELRFAVADAVEAVRMLLG